MDKTYSEIVRNLKDNAEISMEMNSQKNKKATIAFSILDDTIDFWRDLTHRTVPYNWDNLEEYNSSVETATEIDGFAKIEGTDVEEWCQNLTKRIIALLCVQILKHAKKNNYSTWFENVDDAYDEEFKEILKDLIKDHLTTGGFLFKKEEDGKKYTLVKPLNSFKNWKEF